MSLSANGNTLAVGATGEASKGTGVDGDQTDNSMPGAGAVYVFNRSAQGRWTQQAYLKASNTNRGDGFGERVSLSGDARLLAVSAPFEASSATGVDGDQTSNSTVGAGAVYMFARETGGPWTQQAYIKASNTGPYDGFGSSLALSSDGGTLAVGADQERSAATGIDGNQTDRSLLDAGAVYVFTRLDSTWKQHAYVKASNTEADGRFGISVALSADGSSLAVGAKGESGGATGVNGNQASQALLSAGAVYVFRRSGQAWNQQAYVKASNTNTMDFFGCSVAMSADGSVLAIGAHSEGSRAVGLDGDRGDNSLDGPGAVYVFVRDDAGTWSQRSYVKASNTRELAFFGFAVGLSADGQTLAVGSYAESSAATGIGGDQRSTSAGEAGAVYVY